MGVGASTLKGKVNQESLTNILQNNQQSCVSTISNTANNNVVIMNGITSKDDVIGINVSSYSTDATCSITSSTDAALTSILQSISKQKVTSQNDLFGGINVAHANVDINQSMKNYISQLNTSVCNSSAITSTHNNFTYLSNIQSGGSVIGIQQTGNAAARCSINTIVKAQSYNEMKSQLDEDGTVKGVAQSFFSSMFSGLFGIIGIVIIGVLVLMGLGILGYVGYMLLPSKHKQPEPQTQQLQSEQDKLNQNTMLLASLLGNETPTTSDITTSNVISSENTVSNVISSDNTVSNVISSDNTIPNIISSDNAT